MGLGLGRRLRLGLGLGLGFGLRLGLELGLGSGLRVAWTRENSSACVAECSAMSSSKVGSSSSIPGGRGRG